MLGISCVFSLKDSWVLRVPINWDGLGNFLLQIAGLLAQEAQQSAVHFFRVRPCNAVRTILDDQLACSLDKLGGAKSGCRDGKDAVSIPLDHQRGHIDARQILAEVFMPGWDAREAGGSRGAGRDVPTGLN